MTGKRERIVLKKEGGWHGHYSIPTPIKLDQDQQYRKKRNVTPKLIS